MKPITSLALLTLMAITLSGCFVYERRGPARTVVVRDEGPGVRETVITVLPSGYRTRVYRGSTYYYSGDSVYRSYPRGGYTVVNRPW